MEVIFLPFSVAGGRGLQKWYCLVFLYLLRGDAGGGFLGLARSEKFFRGGGARRNLRGRDKSLLGSFAELLRFKGFISPEPSPSYPLNICQTETWMPGKRQDWGTEVCRL